MELLQEERVGASHIIQRKANKLKGRFFLWPHISRTFLPLPGKTSFAAQPARENKARGLLSSASPDTGTICASTHSVNRGASEVLVLSDACLACPWLSRFSGRQLDSLWRLKNEAGTNEKDIQMKTACVAADRL